jgi:hypothetical protein
MRLRIPLTAVQNHSEPGPMNDMPSVSASSSSSLDSPPLGGPTHPAPVADVSARCGRHAGPPECLHPGAHRLLLCCHSTWSGVT